MSTRKAFYSYVASNSSFISRIAFFTDADLLMITFSSGSVWFYYDVPFEIYSALIKAKSHGNYFNNNIRNLYLSEKIGYNISEVLV